MTIPAEMRCVVLHSPGDLRSDTRPTPQPAPGEVLVQVRLVGVCGSDLHYYELGRSGSSVVESPVVLGHEFGGVIVAVGAGVDRTIGERVSVEPGVQCGKCTACRRGIYNHCTDMHFLGAAPTDGAMQEYVAVREDHAFALPDTVSDEAAALIEPLSVALWGVGRARLQRGESVVIVGAGPIGVLCALVARAKGANSVVLVDPADGRRQLAARLTGARVVAPADLEEPDGSFDVALECSGSDSGLETALRSVRDDGRVVVLGVGVDRLDIPMNTLQEGEISVTGSHRYRNTWPAAIDLVARGEVDPTTLITKKFSLDQAEEAILASRTDPSSLKACVHLSGPATGS